MKSAPLRFDIPPSKTGSPKNELIFSTALYSAKLSPQCSWWPTAPLLPGVTRKGWLPHRSKTDWWFTKSNYYNSVYLLYVSRSLRDIAKCVLRDVLKKWNELRCDCFCWKSAEINYPKFPTPLNTRLLQEDSFFIKTTQPKKKSS